MEFLPQNVKDGLDAVERPAADGRSRMRIKVGGLTFNILRTSVKGFAVKASAVQHLRGQVDLYEGTRHVGRCLIVASGLDGDEMLYEFKRNTPVSDCAPLDFAAEDTAAALFFR